MQQQLLATPTQIPDDIARLAHEQKLGTPQGEYAVLTLARSWRWRYFILCSALCLDRSEMKETCLLLYENGQKLPWTSIPTPTIPNFAILMEMIEPVDQEIIRSLVRLERQ